MSEKPKHNKSSKPMGDLYFDTHGEDAADDFLEEVAPFIGRVVQAFNALETDLDWLLADMISDESDKMAAILTGQMTFSKKIETLEKLVSYHETRLGVDLGMSKIYSMLKECSVERNLVVHARWLSADDEKKTYTKLYVKKGEITQVFHMLDAKAMRDVLLFIMRGTDQFHDAWVNLTDVKKMAESKLQG